MFRRRVPLSWTRRILHVLWPAGGWARALRYLRYRIIRLPGTPYGIAAGFASGAAISFTPFLGLHFIGGALIAFILRGNLIASAVGTAVGNPWSFPFIWAWIYTLGHWILGGHSRAELPKSFNWQAFLDNPLELFWPMMVGGIPTALAMWFLFFLPVRRIVSDYQKARRRRLRRKIRRKRIKASHASGAKAGSKAKTAARAKSAAGAQASAESDNAGKCAAIANPGLAATGDGDGVAANPDPVPYPRIVGGTDYGPK